MSDRQECLLLDSRNVEGIEAPQQLGAATWDVQIEPEGNGLVQLGEEGRRDLIGVSKKLMAVTKGAQRQNKKGA